MTEALSGSGSLVIGVGSPLMADDGVGLVALQALRAWEFEPAVELLDGGTWGMSLLPYIEDASRVVILDAIHRGSAPGEVVVVEREALPRYLATKLSPHQIELREVLALAELRGTLPAQTVAMGLEPAKVELSAELTPVVQAGVEALVSTVIQRLEAWGHRARQCARETSMSVVGMGGAGAVGGSPCTS